MKKLYYSRHSENQHINCFSTVLRVVICFIILTDLTKLSVKFWVIVVFKLWVRYRYKKIKEWQDPKLGDAQGTPR